MLLTKIKFQKKLKFCLIQLSSLKKGKKTALDVLREELQEIPKDLDWIVLPEMWLTTAYSQTASQEMSQTREALLFLKSYAQKNAVNISGSQLAFKNGFYSNEAFWINSAGKLSATYSKIHLFKMGEEDKKFKAGNSYKVFSSPYGKFAFAICYDIRFPEFIRSLVLKGARFLIIPSAWPKQRLDHYLSLLKARAIENQCFVISCNKVGKNEKGIVNGGHSVIFDPWGKKLLELGAGPSFGIMSIDLNQVEEIRNQFPVLKCRREDLYNRPLS